MRLNLSDSQKARSQEIAAEMNQTGGGDTGPRFEGLVMNNVIFQIWFIALGHRVVWHLSLTANDNPGGWLQDGIEPGVDLDSGYLDTFEEAIALVADYATTRWKAENSL